MELRNPACMQRLPACPSPQKAKLLLHPDSLNAVTWHVQRDESACHWQAASACGTQCLQTTNRRTPVHGLTLLLPGVLGRGLDIVSSRLQHAHSVYNWQAASTCGAECLQTTDRGAHMKHEEVNAVAPCVLVYTTSTRIHNIHGVSMCICIRGYMCICVYVHMCTRVYAHAYTQIRRVYTHVYTSRICRVCMRIRTYLTGAQRHSGTAAGGKRCRASRVQRGPATRMPRGGGGCTGSTDPEAQRRGGSGAKRCTSTGPQPPLPSADSFLRQGHATKCRARTAPTPAHWR